MSDGANRQTATVGVLLTREDPNSENSEKTTATVVWGSQVHQGITITAPSPEKALRKLKGELEDELFIFQINVFDDPHEIEKELGRRTEATTHKVSHFNEDVREQLTDLFSADPYDGTKRDEDLLDAFDRITEALTKVENGTFDPLYLVSDFDRHATGACVYVPHQDPRHKKERKRDARDIPIKLPGQVREDRHHLAAEAYRAITAERLPKLFHAALKLAEIQGHTSENTGQDTGQDTGQQPASLFDEAGIGEGPVESATRMLAGRLGLDLMGPRPLNVHAAYKLYNHVTRALDSDAQVLTMDELHAVEGLAAYMRPPISNRDASSRRLDHLRSVRTVLEAALGFEPEQTMTSKDFEG